MITDENIDTSLPSPMNEQSNELLTLEELMKLLKISKATAYRYVKQKKFTTYKIGGALRISKESVFQYLEANKI